MPYGIFGGASRRRSRLTLQNLLYLIRANKINHNLRIAFALYFQLLTLRFPCGAVPSWYFSNMPHLSNPWLTLPAQPDYVLPCDSEAIDNYQANSQENHKLHLELMPEPFFGSVTAPVVLLCLNPGFSEPDRVPHANPSFQAALRSNYAHGASSFPFYYLNPNFESPGRDWWRKKLARLMDPGLFTSEQLANSLLCVQYFAYHSRKFRRVRVPSQEYGFGLVRSAIARHAMIVIMRSKRLWIERVPELEKYPRIVTLKNPRNVIISRNNCTGTGFCDLVAAIRNGTR